MESQTFEEFEAEYMNGLTDELRRVDDYYRLTLETNDSIGYDTVNKKLELLSWAGDVLTKTIENKGRNELYSMVAPILEYFDYHYSNDL